ncbi:type IV toxin-antitoxin system AbiEi family antitoxin domain-containing protein [Geodermatophilus sp. SYSU D00705]
MHPLLRARADAQLGLFTSTDALRAGYGHQEIQRRCRAGSWRRLRRGVYATAADLAAAEERGRRHRLDCLAVLLTLGRPATAISSVSAARLGGLPVRRGLEDTVRLTDPVVWRRGEGYRATRASLAPGEVVRAGPVRLTAAALADGRAESPPESRGRLRILGAGLPVPELQVEIRVPGGRLVAVVDAWFDREAVAVEFDGQVEYTDPWRGRSPERVLWEEKRREDELRALGVRVVRVADADLGAGWPALERRLRGLLAVPGPVVRPFEAVPRELGRRRADGPPSS